MTDTLNTQNTEAGNTIDRPLKQARSRAWCFTLNNYDSGDVIFFTDTLDTEKYMFQEETGENGTRHLQGIIYFSNARTFSQMKQLHSKCHWEKTKCIKGSVIYCCKAETRTGKVFSKGWDIPEELELITELREWQMEIFQFLQTKPDQRSIHWYYDPVGNAGKSAFCKYIMNKTAKCHYFCGGKASDIAFQIIESKENPKICLFDFPKTAEGAVSYNAIEMVKNGMVQSGKYKGGLKMFNSPHVIVFSNWLPNLDAMSADRWHIHNI